MKWLALVIRQTFPVSFIVDVGRRRRASSATA